MTTSIEDLSFIDPDKQKHMFLSFCSFVCICHNKKLNIANIFILLLKDPSLKELFIKLGNFDSEYEALKFILYYDTTLYKSKYIKKFLNSRKDYTITPQKQRI